MSEEDIFGVPDFYNSVSPDIEAYPCVDDFVMPTITFMDRRVEDPGHQGEDTHVPGQYETFTSTFYPPFYPYHIYEWFSKRQSDMCDNFPYWWGRYCPRGDGPSLFPRVEMSLSSEDPGTKIVWFDNRWPTSPWRIFFTEVPNFENYPHPEKVVRPDLGWEDRPSAYPDVAVDELTGHPGITYQQWNSNNEDWDIFYKPWNDSQMIKVTVVAEGDTLHYDLYPEDPSDTIATDGITYIWQMNLTEGTYTYYFEAVNEFQSYTSTGLDTVELTRRKGREEFSDPVEIIHSGLYLTVLPNPATGEVAISFSLPVDAHTTIRIYNIAGQKVATLADGRMSAGVHRLQWKGTPGVYFARLETEDRVVTEKLVLLR